MNEERFMSVGLNDLCPNPWNARQNFSGPKFDELVASIDAKGVLQPILVRPLPDGPRLFAPERGEFPNAGRVVTYEVVAGERRFRAAHLIACRLGGPEHATIPAMVRDLTDDDVFDIMTIENLQREGLSEYEEAKSFKAYLDRHGEDALDGLAERVSIKPTYIRRRVKVLTLPQMALDAWQEGKIKYGHLEQLCRIQDPAEVAEYTNGLVNPGWNDPRTVSELKREIDKRAVALGGAVFSLEEEGCIACSHNSSIQKRLFDFGDMEKVSCTRPACYKQKTNNWLTANWAKSPFRKKFKTNGFIFSNKQDWQKHNSFYQKKDVLPECKSCEKFVTAIHDNGAIYTERLCLDKHCLADLQNKADRMERAALNGEEGEEGENSGPRVAWHGEFFREIFYRQEIPARFEQIGEWDDHRVLRMLLFGLLCSVHGLQRWFAVRHGFKDNRGKEMEEGGQWFFMDNLQILRAVLDLPPTHLQQDIAEASLEMVLSGEVIPAGRRGIGNLLGIDLATEWRLTPEYLGKKTTAEMLQLGDSLGIFIQPSVQKFMVETLGKKPGRFDTCKKAELIRVFLESGADLTGKVPAEILAGDDPEPADEPGPGEAHLFEEDLVDEIADPDEVFVFPPALDSVDDADPDGCCLDCEYFCHVLDQINAVQLPDDTAYKCSRPGGLCPAKVATITVKTESASLIGKHGRGLNQIACADCEHKRAMSNKAKGVRIPGKGMGKCIREGGLCEKVETR